MIEAIVLALLIPWISFRLILMGFYVYREILNLRGVYPARTEVNYPKVNVERPKKLDEILEKIQETTEGPPLVGEEVETPVW